jgi:hypothetical protein
MLVSQLAGRDQSVVANVPGIHTERLRQSWIWLWPRADDAPQSRIKHASHHVDWPRLRPATAGCHARRPEGFACAHFFPRSVGFGPTHSVARGALYMAPSMLCQRCVFRSKWASDSTGSGTRFRLKRDMIPLGSGPHFGLERNAVPHGTESRPAWNGTGDGGVESEQAALVIPGRCFPEVKGEYFARTEITHEKNTRNPTPPF